MEMGNLYSYVTSYLGTAQVLSTMVLGLEPGNEYIHNTLLSEVSFKITENFTKIAIKCIKSTQFCITNFTDF